MLNKCAIGIYVSNNSSYIKNFIHWLLSFYKDVINNEILKQRHIQKKSIKPLGTTFLFDILTINQKSIKDHSIVSKLRRDCESLSIQAPEGHTSLFDQSITVFPNVAKFKFRLFGEDESVS